MENLIACLTEHLSAAYQCCHPYQPGLRSQLKKPQRPRRFPVNPLCWKKCVFVPFVLWHIIIGLAVPLPYPRPDWWSLRYLEDLICSFETWERCCFALVLSIPVESPQGGSLHARLVGNSWGTFSNRLTPNSPSFLAAVLDSFDSVLRLWFIIFGQYAYKVYFPNREDRYSLRGSLFSSLQLHFHYFPAVTADNIFVLNMLLKAPHSLSSLISLFSLSASLCQFSTVISFWFIIVIISFPLYH